MLRLSDFVTCRKTYYDQSRGSLSQLWNTDEIQNILTLISKMFMLSQLSDFVVIELEIRVYI